MSVFAWMGTFGIFYLLGAIGIIIASSIIILGDVKDRYSLIDGAIILYQVANIALACACIVLSFLHFAGCFKQDN